MIKLNDQILLKFNVKNKNNRIYKEEEFTRIRNKESIYGLYEWTLLEQLNGYKNFKPYLDDKNMLGNQIRISNPISLMGEIGYPELTCRGDCRFNPFEISENKISHKIENIRIKDNLLIGDVEILYTSSGEKLRQMLEEGNKIVFRPRIIGTINQSSEVIINELFAFDAILASTDAFDLEN